MDWLRLWPRFWIQNKKTFLPWDRALNRALDTHLITQVGAHTCQVGPFEVWISNYPYAFGYNRADALEQLPRCRTRMRLRRAIMKYQTDTYMEQV